MSVECHDLLLWHKVHSVVQHSLDVSQSLTSVVSLVYSLKCDLQSKTKTIISSEKHLDIFKAFHFFCFYLCLLSCRPNKNNTGCFPKARTGRPNHGFFQEFLMKNYFLYACYLGFDLSGWIALIKSEILTTTGMAWPVSSDKWRAP